MNDAVRGMTGGTDPDLVFVRRGAFQRIGMPPGGDNGAGIDRFDVLRNEIQIGNVLSGCGSV